MYAGVREGFFDPGRVYDLFGEILAALNYFSLAFCVFLYVKVGLRTPCVTLFCPYVSETLLLRVSVRQSGPCRAPRDLVVPVCL